ncbi:MAG: hypothetical protein ABI620_03160 [Chloroflexota bacterium]
MVPQLPSHGAARALAAACLTLIVAACSGGASPSPSVAPAGTASGACPTAPSLTGDPTGWGPPATAPQVIPVIINDVACGPNRVLFTMVDPTGKPIGAPDRTASIAIYNLGRETSTPIATLDGTFIWAIENERGIYVINTSFPESGRYGAEFKTAAGGAAPITVRLTFDVRPSSPVIKVGDKAPASKTPILTDVGGDVAKISTDATPDPAFYKTSVDQAIAAHKPFVLIFATPKFCTSAQCGPTLDRIKPYVAKYPGVTFINVEPYKLKLVDGVLTADVDANNQLQTTAVTDEWHLLSEPTVYLVDSTGTVTSNFELIFSDAELTTALDALK